MNVRFYLPHDHDDLKLLKNIIFWREQVNICHFYATLKWTQLRNVTKSVNDQWFMAFYHFKMQYHVINIFKSTSC